MPRNLEAPDAKGLRPRILEQPREGLAKVALDLTGGPRMDIHGVRRRCGRAEHIYFRFCGTFSVRHQDSLKISTYTEGHGR